MKHTAKKPDTRGWPNIKALVWPDINETTEDIVLYEMENPEPIRIKPGERKILPKQAQFIRKTDEYDLVLYGGAMGGGKSWIGLWNVIYHLIMWYVTKGLVNVRAGIFCETYPTLYDRQISKLAERIPKGLGKYNDQRKEFRLKAKFGGGVIMFRNLDKLDRYKSVEFAMIFIDELTENGNASVYDVLSTRLRWKGIAHCPFTAATNPGGPGHQWVYDLCIDKESEAYFRPTLSKKKGIWSKGVYFIQCLPDENPYLGDEYYLKLERLPEKLQKAYLEGDWHVFDGQFFSMFENSVHVMRRKAIPPEWPRFRAFDIGRVNPFVCLWGAVSPSGTLYVYREYSVCGHAASWHKPRIAALSKGESYEVSIGPHDMNRKSASFEGDHTAFEFFNSDTDGGSFELILGGRDKRQRIDALVDALSFEREGSYVDKEGNLQMGRLKRKPRIRIMNNCKNLIRSIRGMVHDESDPEVYAETNAKRPGHGDDEVATLDLLWSIASRGSTGASSDDELPDRLYYDDRDTEYDYAEEGHGTSYADF